MASENDSTKSDPQSPDDCRSREGITVGLIDALIAVARVLATRLEGEQAAGVLEALRDLRGDENVASVLGFQGSTRAEIEEAIGEASMCWERPEDAGEFDSDRAKQIAERLCHRSGAADRSDALELAWGLIANSYGGDWEQATGTWRGAAERWRDLYHAWLHAAGEPEWPMVDLVAAGAPFPAQR